MIGREQGASGDVDLRSPIFFVSYAHAKTQSAARHVPNRRFFQFFEDLSESVAEFVSRPAGSDPGYIDRSIPDGGQWSQELLRAVGTCQVFVALLSPPYFSSEWCAKEWFAFAQRPVVSRDGQPPGYQTAIIPVVWAPLRLARIPPVVAAVQRFSPRNLPDSDIPAEYEKEGVRGLMQMGRDLDYQTVIWRLAERIAELHHGYRVEPRTLSAGELTNIFGKSDDDQ